MTVQYALLQLSTQGCAYDGGINGAPLVFAHDGEGMSTLLPLNHWLMPEGNELTVRVRPLAKDVARRSSCFLEAAIKDPEDDEEPSPCRISWKYAPDQDFAPFELRLPFVWSRIPATRLWREATQLDALDEKQLAGARQAGLDLLAAFVRQDVERVMELLDYRIRDMVLAFEDDLAEHSARVKKAYQELAAKGGFRQVEPHEIDVRKVAGGRAFALTARGADLIDGNGGSMPIFVSLVDGRWVVSR